MLDPGSQITSIAESFYRRHLADCTIQPLGNLVRVVGAGGEDVPYLGYTTVKNEFPVEDVGINSSFDTPVLVVPDNESGLIVTPALFTLPARVTKPRIPVEATNNSSNPITVRPKSVISWAQVANEVTNFAPTRSEGQEEQSILDSMFGLDEAPLTETQKKQARELLMKMSCVC